MLFLLILYRIFFLSFSIFFFGRRRRRRRWDRRRRGRDQTALPWPRRLLRLPRHRQRQPSRPAGGVRVKDEAAARKRSPSHPIRLYSISSVKYAHSFICPSHAGLISFGVNPHFSITVSISQQIMKKFGVAPFDQHLTCNGRDLNDNPATLASLRIFPGTVIILQVIIKSRTTSCICCCRLVSYFLFLRVRMDWGLCGTS